MAVGNLFGAGIAKGVQGVMSPGASALSRAAAQGIDDSTVIRVSPQTTFVGPGAAPVQTSFTTTAVSPGQVTFTPPAMPVSLPAGLPAPRLGVLLDMGKQGKHIPGHNNFIIGKSPLTHPDPRALFDQFAGQGQPVGNVPRGKPGFKERVDFGQVIGEHNGQPTTKGIIHYAKDGAHIVPARP